MALRSRAADGAKPYLTKEELIKVVQWKLWIGAMRPTLLQNAKDSKPEKVMLLLLPRDGCRWCRCLCIASTVNTVKKEE